MARERNRNVQHPSPKSASDPHHGHGGSYVIAGGVNHDVEQEGTRELVERTEHRIVRSVALEESERQKKAEAEVSGEAQQPTGE